MTLTLPVRKKWERVRLRRVHQKVERALTALAVACFWIPFLPDLISPLVSSPGESPGLVLITPLTRGAADLWLAAAICCVFFVWLSVVGVPRRASVAVDSRCLYITTGKTEQRIPRARISAGSVGARRIGEVELQLSTGDCLRLDVGDVKVATELVDALGLGNEKRRVKITLARPGHLVIRAAIAILGSAYVSFILLGRLTAKLESAAPMSSYYLWIVLGLLVFRALRPAEITIGADGVAVRTMLRSFFIPYAALKKMGYRGREIYWHISRGRRISVRGWSADIAKAAVERTIETMAVSHEQERVAQTGWLERRGMTLSNWRASVVAGLRPSSSYRAASRSADDALRILAAANERAEHRVGAALALVGAKHKGASAKARAAAAACADPKLRIALTKIAADEEAEAEIEAVLALDTERTATQ